MSGDGAHLGLSAESSMKAAMGSDEPIQPMTMEEFVASVRSATKADARTYDGTARYAARLIVDWLLTDPRRASGPTENVYANGDDGRMVWPAVVLEHGWYDRMKADGIPLDDLDLTGFMWGWAVNAARRCVELPAVPNPAIVTIGGDA